MQIGEMLRYTCSKGNGKKEYDYSLFQEETIPRSCDYVTIHETGVKFILVVESRVAFNRLVNAIFFENTCIILCGGGLSYLNTNESYGSTSSFRFSR